jgi:hypothetical protein
MIRELGLRLLLLALPFAVFGLYLFLMRWRPGHAPPKTPWTILFITGLSLFAVSFVFWRFNEDVEATGTYVPPHVEDGKVVPGHTEGG